MKKAKAVLFDFDGVIADTMSGNYLAWKKAFKDFGIVITEDDYYPLEGHTTREIAQIILDKYKKKANPKILADLKHAYYLKGKSPHIYQYVNEIINFLSRKKVILALITASDQRRLKQAVPQLLERFDLIVTGDTMKKGKPSPQLYLYAMKQMSLQPKDCIVIENAPLGITSAKNAGCNCIAITTTVQRRHLERADIIVASHLELLLTLKEIYNA